MAQLKDTIVQGSLRATDTIYADKAQFNILNAPTLTVAKGGTGVTSFTNDCVIVAAGSPQTLVNRGLQITGESGANITLSPNTSGNTLTLSTSSASLTIDSGTTLYLNKPTTASIIFTRGGATGANAMARFNPSGMFEINDGGTQDTHRFYVNGNSAFNGKIAFGEQASNVITEKASIQYDSTLQAIKFIVT